MSYTTYTTTESTTFTVTHARHVAIKVGTDLKRMQRFYDRPTDPEIADYEREFIALLTGRYLDKVEYGFQSVDGDWRLALRYEARYGGVLIADDDPGRVRPGVSVDSCEFGSFLITTSAWAVLSEWERDRIYVEAGVTFRRSVGTEPRGNWIADKTYSAAGRGVERSSLNYGWN